MNQSRLFALHGSEIGVNVANKNANRIPMSGTLVWAQVMRPRTPLIYIDLNHFILMARANIAHPKTPNGYRELLNAARSAVQQGRAQVVLSCEHLFEMSAINDPRQRKDIAQIMEELSQFHYILGRPEIARLEIEAGIATVLGEIIEPLHHPLIGPTFGRAFGMRGGLRISNAQGQDEAVRLREEIGHNEFEAMMGQMNRDFERHMLEGPSDIEAEKLRAGYGYAPETARSAQQSRLDFELELSKILAANPKWRRGRLRDVVSAREIIHEWLDMFNEVNQERLDAGKPTLDPGDERMRDLMAAMPHTQVAISMKTRYHRDPAHHWTSNDIVDIDAMSVAYAYCDAAFTDKAARAALASSTELRALGTYLPRTPMELSDWLDAQRPLATGQLLVPAGPASRLKS